MNGQRSTIGLLERLAEMKSRFRQVASKVSQHVSCALSGGQWTATNDNPAVSPAVTLLDYKQSDHCADSDQPSLPGEWAAERPTG